MILQDAHAVRRHAQGQNARDGRAVEPLRPPLQGLKPPCGQHDEPGVQEVEMPPAVVDHRLAQHHVPHEQRPQQRGAQQQQLFRLPQALARMAEPFPCRSQLAYGAQGEEIQRQGVEHHPGQIASGQGGDRLIVPLAPEQHHARPPAELRGIFQDVLKIFQRPIPCGGGQQQEEPAEGDHRRQRGQHRRAAPLLPGRHRDQRRHGQHPPDRQPDDLGIGRQRTRQ